MAKVVKGQHMRFQPMKSHAMSHNHRLTTPSYVHSDKSDLNVTYVQTDKRSLTEYIKEVKADYQENVGRRYQDNFSPLWETLIVVNDNTKDEDIERAIKLIEEKTGLKIVDAVRHKDEGHYDKDGEYIANDHVHLIAKRYDFETHRHVVLDVQKIRDLRKDVADTLGIAYTQTKEGEKPQKNISHHKFREEAQKEQIIELQKELSKTTAKDYSLKEMQNRIVNLEGANTELRKELHAQNREINKTKDLEEKERKITELEAKIKEIEGEKTELIEQIITREQTIDQLKSDLENTPQISQPIHGSKFAKLQEEYEMLQITNRVLERELKEAKEAPTPKGENEASKEIEEAYKKLPNGTLEDTAPTAEEIESQRAAMKELVMRQEKDDFVEKLIDEHLKLGFTNKQELAKSFRRELKANHELHKKNYKMLPLLHEMKTKAMEAFKGVAKNSISALESVFSKITGKSMPEVKKEREEHLNAQKERERLERQKEDRGKGIER